MQMGIGAIPDAVLKYLFDKKDLGIHTELFSDGVIELVNSGVLTSAKKTLHPGKIIAGFILGTQRLYDWVHDNPLIEFHRTEYVNDPFVIAKNKRMVALNSAIEVDLTGQVCADSIGPKLYSGVGGQLDFIYGASRSEGGVPIIALPSTAKDFSRIVPLLKHGAGVVTTRNHVHYVVTEYGVADLYGKSIRQRAQALINIAHPDFRADLKRQARALHYI
jgi:acetyl-CoA hydrolase